MVFDYVTASPKETSRSMQRSSMKYNLSIHAERKKLVLLHRQQRQGQHIEFWMNITMTKKITKCPGATRRLDNARKGILAFEVIYFPKNNGSRRDLWSYWSNWNNK